MYSEVDGKIEIEFGEPKIETTLNDCRLSELIWMAPEMLKKNSKPVSHCQSKILLNFNEFFQFQSAASDVFSLGLLFFFMLTKRRSPLDIHTTFLKNEFHHKIKIDLQLLEDMTKNTDTILLIDLIKRMIQEDPDQRETCEDLIEHAALKDNEERFKIVLYLAGKCFENDECKNEYLVKVIDKKEVHLEGFLGKDSAEWKEFLAEAAKLPEPKEDIKICSSLLKIFFNQVIESNYQGL